MITLNGKLLASFNHVWVVPSDEFGTYSKIGVLGRPKKSRYVSPKTHMPSIQQNFE